MGARPEIEHLLRRAGFGARPDELDRYGQMSVGRAIETLLDYASTPDDVDGKIQQPGYVGVTARGQFSPQSVIADARQRWLFRMVHSDRPLQEKMTLFWCNHFATGYNKIAGTLGATEATRYLAAKRSEDAGQVRGQLELFRDQALGNFRDLLLEVAKDTAMLVWLDGRTNTKAKPQENFAREIMELFTMGVGHYTESDVYAGARVFTGWNLQRPGAAGDPAQHYEFNYVANQHDTGEKTFSFPVYGNGSRTIPGRSASDGMQDGVDFISALAGNRIPRGISPPGCNTFFVSEAGGPDPAFVDRVAAAYLQSGYDMKAVMREVLSSSQFWDPAAYFARYSWPVEFVVRALKDIGWRGFSVNDALGPLANMGQTLFEPPDVAGWDTGQAWFSTGGMLARMNFAATVAGNQRFNLASAAKPFAASPESVLSYFLDQLASAPLDGSVMLELAGYLRATGAWTGSDAQLQVKAAGLVHLLVGSAEYQFQ